MADIILPDFPNLPANLPEDWVWDQIIPPNGADVGKPEQYGYNYLMQMINRAHEAANMLKEAAESLSANKVNNADVYTKAQIDGQLASKVNMAGDEMSGPLTTTKLILKDELGKTWSLSKYDGLNIGNFSIDDLRLNNQRVFREGMSDAISVAGIVLKDSLGGTTEISKFSGTDVVNIGSNYLRLNNQPIWQSNQGNAYLQDNAFDIGNAGQRTRDIYLANSPTVGSDKRIKKDISSLEVRLIISFLKVLNPVQFRYINGNSGRFHYGFIAQEVEAALTAAGLTSMDFAGLIKSPVIDADGNETGDYIYALRQEEFISALVKGWQNHEERIALLETKLDTLVVK